MSNGDIVDFDCGVHTILGFDPTLIRESGSFAMTRGYLMPLGRRT